MRRVIVIAVAGASLAGCSSFSMDAFKSTPPAVQVQLDSVPPGADAVTSVGPSCKTPCSVAVQAPDAGFSVTYTLNKFQPTTVPVQVIRVPGDSDHPGLDDVRSQSGGRGTSAGRPAAQGCPEEGFEAKEAEGHGRGNRAPGHPRFPIRRKPARRRPAADCLHRTNRVCGLSADCIVHRL